MDMQTFIRKPFTVEAVQITNENIRELAPLIGSLRTHRGKFFIEVNRKKVPVLSEVEVGFWMTRIPNGRIRCYSDEVFKEQFTALTKEINDWVEYLNTTTGVEEEATLNSG